VAVRRCSTGMTAASGLVRAPLQVGCRLGRDTFVLQAWTWIAVGAADRQIDRAAVRGRVTG
jgi:hypothetical protein